MSSVQPSKRRGDYESRGEASGTNEARRELPCGGGAGEPARALVSVIVGAWCYLRPSELLGLERRDIGEGVLDVRGTKTARSRRSVPVPLRARQALDGLPARIDARLLSPGPGGTSYDLRNFGRRQFKWAVAAAGLPESVTPYTLRHSGISWALASGIRAVDVARYGGTSVTMRERVYHHLLVSSADSARARLDEFMAATKAADEATR